jgi:hypothetical protein
LNRREIAVPELDIGLTFSTANVILLALATAILVKVRYQLKQLSRCTNLLKDAADRMTSMDRHSASQVARIAREISADVGKLRRIDISDGKAQLQSCG